MHGLRKHLRVRDLIGRLGRQDGWVLMDAVWSSVVVVLAFIGTTMAFEGSNRSVVRDQTKSQAMVVAQNELEEMRAEARIDINKLACTTASRADCINGTTDVVNYKGVAYDVARTAYYTDSVDGDPVDACGAPYSSGNASARYLYMKVVVTYSGQNTYAGGGFSSAPTMLDSYYAPEAGTGQANTGTLRVYVLDRDGALITPATKLFLYDGTNSQVDSGTVNSSTGCYLFTGLSRQNYFVKANVTSGRQDLYLSNTGSGVVTQTVRMPFRGALTRVLRIDRPNTVTAAFRTKNDNGGTVTLNPSNQQSSAFVGPWVAMNDEIVSDPTVEFAAGPGRTYMPHSNATIKNLLFPTADGYDTYAGPCNLNNPDDGNTSNGSEWTSLPASGQLGTSAWQPGSTYTGLAFDLTRLRTHVFAAGGGAPTAPLRANATYYWGQTLVSGRVNVMLTGDQSNNSIYVSCGNNASLFNNWVRLPGTVSTTGAKVGYLTDQAEALPAGTYSVCVRAEVQATKRSTNSWGSWSTSATYQTFTVYRTVDAQDLTSKANLGVDFDLSDIAANEGSTSTCSGANWT